MAGDILGISAEEWVTNQIAEGWRREVMAGDYLQRWLADIDCKPSTLRIYADVFEMSRRDTPNGPLRKPSDIAVTAAKCFRLAADLKDLQAVLTDTDPNDPNVTMYNKLIDTTGPSVNEFIDAKYLAR